MSDWNHSDAGETAKLDGEGVVGLDAYSSDGQFVGRVTGYLPAVPENEQAAQEGQTDTVDSHGHRHGVPHLVINGKGTAVQSTLIVTPDSLNVDLAGRRVTLPLTIAQIEAMPQHDPNEPTPEAMP